MNFFLALNVLFVTFLAIQAVKQELSLNVTNQFSRRPVSGKFDYQVMNKSKFFSIEGTIKERVFDSKMTLKTSFNHFLDAYHIILKFTPDKDIYAKLIISNITIYNDFRRTLDYFKPNTYIISKGLTVVYEKI